MFVDLQGKIEYCHYNPTNSGQDKKELGFFAQF